MKQLGKSAGKNLNWLLLTLLFAGCSKAEKTQAQTRGKEAQTESAVFKPTTAKPAESTPAPADLKATYEAAASAFTSFSQSLPYERKAIFKSAMPLVAKLAAENSALIGKSSQDFSVLARLDYRFQGAMFDPVFQSTFPVLSGPEDSKSKSVKKFSVEDPGGLPPQQSNPDEEASGDALKVSRAGPDAVAEALANTGTGIGIAGKNLHLDGVTTKEVERLLKEALAAGNAWSNKLTLQSADRLETRTAKLAVLASFGDLLGKIVLQNGSFYLGVKDPATKQLEIWEFKNPISLNIERVPVGSRLRENTGIQAIANLHYNAQTPDMAYRRFACGWWSTWRPFPDLGTIKITKTEKWVVEYSTPSVRPLFWKLTAEELKIAASRSQTAHITGKFESGVNEADDSETENGESVLEAYGALGDLEGATRYTEQIQKQDKTSAKAARQAIAGLANFLAQTNPKEASDLFDGQLFGYFSTYKTAPENIEMLKLPNPKRGTVEHPYGKASPAVELMKSFYQKLMVAEPGNSDAAYDFALLCMVGTQDDYKAAVDALESILTSKGSSASGRDFAKLISGSYSFVGLDTGSDSYRDPFHRLLKSCGSNSDSYYRRFESPIHYFQFGY